LGRGVTSLDGKRRKNLKKTKTDRAFAGAKGGTKGGRGRKGAGARSTTFLLSFTLEIERSGRLKKNPLAP